MERDVVKALLAKHATLGSASKKLGCDPRTVCKYFIAAINKLRKAQGLPPWTRAESKAYLRARHYEAPPSDAVRKASSIRGKMPEAHYHSKATGLKVCHKRWHVNRNIIDPKCPLCTAA